MEGVRLGLFVSTARASLWLCPGSGEVARGMRGLLPLASPGGLKGTRSEARFPTEHCLAAPAENASGAPVPLAAGPTGASPGNFN